MQTSYTRMDLNNLFLGYVCVNYYRPTRIHSSQLPRCFLLSRDCHPSHRPPMGMHWMAYNPLIILFKHGRFAWIKMAYLGWPLRPLRHCDEQKDLSDLIRSPSK